MSVVIAIIPAYIWGYSIGSLGRSIYSSFFICMNASAYICTCANVTVCANSRWPGAPVSRECKERERVALDERYKKISGLKIGFRENESVAHLLRIAPRGLFLLLYITAARFWCVIRKVCKVGASIFARVRAKKTRGEDSCCIESRKINNFFRLPFLQYIIQ